MLELALTLASLAIFVPAMSALAWVHNHSFGRQPQQNT